jgi:hypothetical protein
MQQRRWTKSETIRVSVVTHSHHRHAALKSSGGAMDNSLWLNRNGAIENKLDECRNLLV